MVLISPYSDAADARVMNYDFLTEISPGVWKVCDKTNRTEWLAHDINDSLSTDTTKPTRQNKTTFRHLMETEQRRVLNPMVTILSHDNLVRLKDWVTVKKPLVGGDIEYRSYAVWDYCDAGILGNLLVPQYAHDINRSRDYPDTDPDSDFDVDGYNLDPQGRLFKFRGPLERYIEPFMPESLCWHVLLSIMKALAWLHDGSWEVLTDKDGRYEMSPEQDWEPILHRNIHPNNIFFQHPEATEWYGACKLGNYGNLYISGHHPGNVSQPSDARHFSKALAPHRLTEFVPLETLVSEDGQRGYAYPHLPDQPYTLISELRALGEILQQMMLEPGRDIDYGLNISRKQTVEQNIGHTKYSAPLKNMVALLMTYNHDEKLADGSYMQANNRECFTSMICVDAHTSFRQWQQLGSPEAKKATLREDAIRKQQSWGRILGMVEELRQNALVKVQQKDDKVEKSLFAVPKPERQSLDHLDIVNSNPITIIPPEVVGVTEDDKVFTMEYFQSFLKDTIV